MPPDPSRITVWPTERWRVTHLSECFRSRRHGPHALLGTCATGRRRRRCVALRVRSRTLPLGRTHLVLEVLLVHLFVFIALLGVHGLFLDHGAQLTFDLQLLLRELEQLGLCSRGCHGDYCSRIEHVGLSPPAVSAWHGGERGSRVAQPRPTQRSLRFRIRRQVWSQGGIALLGKLRWLHLALEAARPPRSVAPRLNSVRCSRAAPHPPAASHCAEGAALPLGRPPLASHHTRPGLWGRLEGACPGSDFSSLSDTTGLPDDPTHIHTADARQCYCLGDLPGGAG
jgi:hypothetical protein